MTEPKPAKLTKDQRRRAWLDRNLKTAETSKRKIQFASEYLRAVLVSLPDDQLDEIVELSVCELIKLADRLQQVSASTDKESFASFATVPK